MATLTAKQKNNKLLLFFLILFTVVGVGYSLYSLYNQVYGPFKTSGETQTLTEMEQEAQEQSLQYIMYLHNNDADNDGLSDYEELYDYGTTPYLSDTDSDGLDDKTELSQGMDPLCHKDKDCGNLDVVMPSVSDLEKQIPDYDQAQVDVPELNMDLLKQNLDNMSADKLRTMLKQGGFPKEQLDSFSDEKLMQTWQGVAEKQM